MSSKNNVLISINGNIVDLEKDNLSDVRETLSYHPSIEMVTLWIDSVTVFYGKSSILLDKMDKLLENVFIKDEEGDVKEKCNTEEKDNVEKDGNIEYDDY